MFLEGTAGTTIAKYLSDNNIPSPAGKKVWSESTIRSILHNEKYKGDAILQKSFTVDFLTKRKKVNEGEVPQYYVENSHPAIISAEVFDLAQAEFEKRRNDRDLRRSSSCFSGKIICGECGSFYGNKTWYSNSKYRKVVWRCNHKYDNNETCKTPHIYEDKLKELFVKAFNEVIENKDEILRDYKEIIEVLGDTSKLEKEKLQLENEAEVLVELLKKHVERNSYAALNQEEYEDKYNELANKYQGVKNRIEEVEKKIFNQKIKFENIKEFIERLEKCNDLITEFDEGIWSSVIESVTIKTEQDIIFVFKNKVDKSIN